MRKAVNLMCLLMAMALIVTMGLSGCGSSRPSTGDESSKTTESVKSGGETQAAETKPELEFVSLKLTVPGGKQKDHDVVMAEWNKYLKDKINAELIVEPLPWDSQRDKLTAMLAAKEPLDISFTASWNGYYNDVAKGAFAELDPLIDQYAPDMKKLINPLYLEGPRIKGKLYMIPTNKEIADAHSMWFRTDLLKKHGLTVTQGMTIEDFEPLFRTIKEKEPDISPTEGNISWYGVTKEDVENFEKYDYVPGYDYMYVEHAGGKVISRYDLDWWAKRYAVYRDYFQKGYFNRDIQDKKVTKEDLNKAQKLFSYTGMVKPGEDILEKTRNNFTEVPTMVAALKPKINTYSTTGAGAAITSYSKNKERAMMVINLLWSDETLIHFVQDGIEGKHYVKVPDVKFHKKLPEGVKTPSDTGYDPGFWWQFGNDMLNLIWDTEPADKHEQYQKYNESGYRSPILGFYFDPENVKTEVAAINNVFETHRYVLDDGKVDPDKTVAQLKEKLKASGIDKVVAECQKQYDDWKSYQK